MCDSTNYTIINFTVLLWKSAEISFSQSPSQMVYYVDLMFSYSPNWINFTISGGGCQNIFVECEPQSCSSYHVQGNALSAWLKRVYYARSPVVDFEYGLLSQHLNHIGLSQRLQLSAVRLDHTRMVPGTMVECIPGDLWKSNRDM